ncbi:MAG: NAD(P)-dependent oxidoreductase [Rhodospirillaceae bacterium]|nr:NAD(P)-dependent oxidoreductase [Rhodospirillaceae bacterium]
MNPKDYGTVGVIGLGSMGLGMAQSLKRAGFDVIGCDVSAAARARFAPDGDHATGSAADLASCEAIVSVVINADQVEAILFGSDGLAKSMRRGAIVIACSTVAPAFAKSTAEALAARGLLYLDAPISGGQAKAAAGALTVMASGTGAAFAKAGPLMDAMAETVYRLGDEPGQGSSVKMINQLLAGVHIAAASEAMALGIKVGIDPQTLYDVICKSAGCSWMFENRVPRILAGAYQPPQSSVNIFTKDLGIVLDTARRQTFPTPLAAAAYQLFTMAAAAGMGADDDSSVVRVYERLSDIVLPKGQ